MNFFVRVLYQLVTFTVKDDDRLRLHPELIVDSEDC